MQKIKIEEFDITIQKKRGVKCLKMRFNKKGEVMVSIPWWVGYRAGSAFAAKNVDWIRAHKEKHPDVKRFVDGMSISLMGVDVTVRHNPAAKRGVWIEGAELFVSGPAEYLHRRVRDFVKRHAYEIVQEKSIHYAAKIGKRPIQITLKDTSSRWGSCSHDGKLSYCWKLALAPDFVFDYIIAHEVAHLKHMDHSRDFWKTTTDLTEHTANAKIWLKKHGGSLQAWE